MGGAAQDRGREKDAGSNPNRLARERRERSGFEFLQISEESGEEMRVRIPTD